jgi:DNA-binding NtrC family response regulator
MKCRSKGEQSTPLSANPEVLGSLIGQSLPMQELARQVERVLQSDITVSIFGESGTGKELVSRAIHDGGPRRRGPFVAINCAAIPASLQESELFGHERGAFTGATHLRLGCFEQTNGGTLFLDEIGEMSASTQAMLLRTLQERTVRRVGGFGELPIDVRIICASRRDLLAEVECGRFRQDLYFRLVVYPIELPPLRVRNGDIALLVAHTLDRLQSDEGRRVTRMRPAALEALTRYSWPGNVRELINVVHRSLLSCQADEITLADLPAHIRSTVIPTAPPSSQREVAVGTTPLLPEARETVMPLREIERYAIEHALGLAEGNVCKAAKMLCISRAKLYRRIASLSTGLGPYDGKDHVSVRSARPPRVGAALRGRTEGTSQRRSSRRNANCAGPSPIAPVVSAVAPMESSGAQHHDGSRTLAHLSTGARRSR